MTRLTVDDFSAARVLPVIEIDNAAHAADLAAALKAGGMTCLELTLRTAAALPALAAMKKAEPSLLVGMGTVLSVDDAKASIDQGADFLVTPGTTSGLLAGLAKLEVTSLPGTATLSEAMRAMEHGFDFLKFFPAEAAGGMAMLKSFAGPLAKARFCPTGGISKDKIAAYLALPNVVCVGGSWVAPRDLINAGDWDTISKNASLAVA